MARRMADPLFRTRQREGSYAEHVRPVNELVDALRATGAGWVPHVAPHHGGVDARALLVLRSPGRATAARGGSGFLSTENDDETAKTMSELLVGVGIDTRSIVLWNAYPWLIDGAPSTTQVKAGSEPLVRLLDLLPDLRVILLHGGEAQRCWQHAVVRYPALRSRLPVVRTYSPSPQALFHPDPEVRAARAAHRQAAYAEVARSLSIPLEPA
ncbi:uracil-DNA glycosylase family protein [Kineococcus arenarius]|uniref:uracil-DNA glycosylase family protein n=1 Tax=Kineococcus sp. SYSU DK007 TaxID=3383128 RepID=UPI003D7C53EC